jgi:hypothetical protein
VSDAAAGNNVVLSFADYTLPDNANVDVLKLAGSATLATGNHDAAGDQLWANFNPGESSTLTGESHNDVFVVFNPGDTVGRAAQFDRHRLQPRRLHAAGQCRHPQARRSDSFARDRQQRRGGGDQLWANPGVTSTLRDSVTMPGVRRSRF